MTDLEKYTRYFIHKAIQVIVQSRLGLEKIHTRCDPGGNDFFNLAIKDYKDVTETVTKCLDSIDDTSDQKKFTIKKEWNICCEISLKNSEGDSMVLEYWLFSNEVLLTSTSTVPAPEDIYNVYNRMCLLLKSIAVLTRAAPAYRVSSSGQSAETFIVCYRVFNADKEALRRLAEKTTKKKFATPVKLGTIVNYISSLSVSLVYRTTMTSGKGKTSITGSQSQDSDLMPGLKADHFSRENIEESKLGASSTSQAKPLPSSTSLTSPLFTEGPRKVPAFVNPSSSKSVIDEINLVPETAFLSLLTQSQLPGKAEDAPDDPTPEGPVIKTTVSTTGTTTVAMTSTDAMASSSADESFVIVEAPFASQEKILGSFFNGPAPSFADSEDILTHLNELSREIEEIESSVPQWDSFVESVCSSSRGEGDESTIEQSTIRPRQDFRRGASPPSREFGSPKD